MKHQRYYCSNLSRTPAEPNAARSYWHSHFYLYLAIKSTEHHIYAKSHRKTYIPCQQRPGACKIRMKYRKYKEEYWAHWTSVLRCLQGELCSTIFFTGGTLFGTTQIVHTRWYTTRAVIPHTAKTVMKNTPTNFYWYYWYLLKICPFELEPLQHVGSVSCM